MRRIYKWPLDREVSSLPWSPDDRVLLIASQRNVLTLWADQKDTSASDHRDFTVVGTGHAVPAGFDHVGSAVVGDFVWHVYAEPVEVPF